MKVIVLAHKLSRPGVLFGMSDDDAVALCSDPRSKGRRWMTAFAPVEEWQVSGAIPARAKIEDTGKLDPIIEDLGLTKYEI